MARTLGASKFNLIFKHILPNTLGAIVVTSMFTVPSAIFFEAFLSFIGIGVPAPQTSLGSLVNDGRAMLLIHPHELFIPATVLSLLILFFYLFSDGLRDAFDLKCVNKKEAKGMSERVLEVNDLHVSFDITAGKCKQLEA